MSFVTLGRFLASKTSLETSRRRGFTGVPGPGRRSGVVSPPAGISPPSRGPFGLMAENFLAACGNGLLRRSLGLGEVPCGTRFLFLFFSLSLC